MVDPTNTYKQTFIWLLLGLVITFLLNISLGSVSIPLNNIIKVLIGNTINDSAWQTIIIDYRLPKAITAVIVGAGLSISGLLLQTLFRNPLAGPFVLGISSGASLGVATLILGSAIVGISITSFSFANWAQAIAASIGSFLVLIAIMIAAIKVRNTMSLLIIGLMFGSFTSAIISVLAYFSNSSQLQQYLFWSFGSLGNLNWQQISLLAVIFVFSIILILFIIKPLNSLLLGENYAKSMGVNVTKTRNLILISTSLLTGVITSFSGPIAFIGLAIPHLTKLLFSVSNHKILLPAVAISGAIVMLLCDSIAQLPSIQYTLPINAITSLLGAPIIIWLLVRKKKIYT